MTRRDLTIAAITITLGATIALLVATLGGDDNRGNGDPGELVVTLTQPATTTVPEDPDAARAAIERLARAYQLALDPTSDDDPCRYLTPLDRQAEDGTELAPESNTRGGPRVTSAGGCPRRPRARERARPQPLYTLGEKGVTDIEFLVPGGDGRPFDAGAQAVWKGDRRRVVYFTQQEDGSWRIDTLPGAE